MPKVYLATQTKSKEYLRIYIDLIISITTNKSFTINDSRNQSGELCKYVLRNFFTQCNKMYNICIYIALF